MSFPHVSEMLDYEDEYFLEEDKMTESVPPLQLEEQNVPLTAPQQHSQQQLSHLHLNVRLEQFQNKPVAVLINNKPEEIEPIINMEQQQESMPLGDESTKEYSVEQTLEEQFMEVDLNNVPYYILKRAHIENSMGMTVTSGSVTIVKDTSNLIGISIGGGAPLCPCLYIVQVFDNTPAAKEGTLQSGDELLGVGGQSVKGKTKVEVARMIQSCEGQVTIHYNKLHADPQQGRTLDVLLKKVKHRLVENMSSATADALGLSRAILCNDSLVKKLQELELTEGMYRGLVEHTQKMLRATFELLQVYKAFGDTFAAIGVREPQPRASEAFRTFGDQHRQMEKAGIKMLQTVKPILSDLGTYLYKAIPDTKLTIKKYADTKFEYLSYCLKVKEMDDEEYSYNTLQEPLYRLETGNYEYRLILRCRQDARARFARLRSDVLVKLELLDNKHVQDVVRQLQRLLSGLAGFHEEALELLGDNQLFPVEVDLSRSAFNYPQHQQQQAEDEEEDDPADEDDVELLTGEEAKESTPEEADLIGNLID